MLLGLAGSLLKTLGKRNSKKNAQNMVGGGTDNSNDDQSNDQSNGEDIPRKYIIVADIRPLEDIRDDMKGSSKKSKDPFNLALDGIDNALFGIIDTLGNIEKKKLDMADESTKAQQDKKKTLRERFLESGAVKGVVGSVKGAVGNTWDKIMQFLTWTLIGGIVNAIIKNWDEIQQQIKKVVDQLRELYEGLEPILTPIVKWVKWIAIKGIEWTTKIDEKQKEMDHEGKYNEIKKQLLLMDKWEKEFDSVDKDLGNMMIEIQNAKSQEEVDEILDKYKNKLPQEEKNTNLYNEKGQIDPKTFIEDEDNPGEMLRFSETFDKPLDEEGKKNEIEEWKSKYYVDQHGTVRHKDTNGKAAGARWMGFGTGIEFEDIKKMLEKRIYDKKTNTSTLTNTSSLDSRSLNNIQSKSYDLASISKYFDEFNIDTTILITGEEGSSSIHQGSSPIILSSFGEDSFTIDQALLLKLYNE